MSGDALFSQDTKSGLLGPLKALYVAGTLEPCASSGTSGGAEAK